jgi:hypothetical protein
VAGAFIRMLSLVFADLEHRYSLMGAPVSAANYLKLVWNV